MKSLYLLFSKALRPNLHLELLVVEISRSHTIKHIRWVGLTEWSALRRSRYLHTTQPTQETKVLSQQRSSKPRSQQSRGL